MKAIKRIISMALALALFGSLVTTVFAVENRTTAQENWMDSEEYGTFYSKVTEEESVVALYDKDKQTMDIYIRYLQEDEYTVFKWTISYSPILSSPTLKSFWTKAINSVRGTRNAAEIIKLTPPTERKEDTLIRSSANADMYDQLVSKHGSAPYNNKLKYTSLTTMETIRIYEDMQFFFGNVWESAFWVAGSALALVVTICTGLPIDSQSLQFFSILFGVASLANALVSAGNVTKYTPRAQFVRHSSINGSSYWYTQTTKTIEYEAYEDNTTHGTGRVEIFWSTASPYYSDSASFFNNFSSQEYEAYRIFQLMGQMP